MEELDAVVLAPRIGENDDFLTVIERCYSKKKDRLVGEELKRKASEAKSRIQRKIPELFTKPMTWRITNESEFRDFRDSGLWDDLKPKQKAEIYDRRIRGNPFEIRETYDQKTDRRIVNIISITTEKYIPPAVYTILEKSDEVEQKTQEKPSVSRKSRPENLPLLINLQDFQEYGKVKKFLEKKPSADDREIASETKLPVWRVAALRALIAHESKSGN